MPFYTGLKQDGIIMINSKTPINFSKDEEREMAEKGAKIYYLPATEIDGSLTVETGWNHHDQQ